MKKVSSVLLTGILTCAMAGCGVGGSAATSAASAPAASTSASESTAAAAVDSDKTFLIGIDQLVQHPALDNATKGFKDVLTETYGDKVTFDEQNAAGDAATAATIANALVSEKCDLILANATAALQACSQATNTIPVLGTSITEYGVALGLDNFSGTVGTNVTGTSDLAPLDQQADLFDELLPDAQNIGILYCTSEPNSKYQADEVQKALEAKGKTVTVYTFTDSNDVNQVTKDAVGKSDALYIPTDNTAASCAETINNIALPAGVPIIAGEEGIMSGCGIATLSIDYYELGRTTGEMAVKILNGEAKPEDMPIEYYQNPVKEYDADRCAQLGITVPDDFTAYTAD